jgi:predicted glycoside hydrolase/deacetylase ChbG (UPF0249 family)
MTFEEFARGHRYVVIHEDDVGMTHGANTAFAELSALGTCSSGSVMVPCPWFAEAAELAAANRALDIGVHLTLTSEKKPYRWRPLTCPPASAGLTDPMGCFWPDVPNVRRHAAPDAVEAELRAQIETAIAVGFDLTHLDSHMGTVMCPEFVDIYLRLGVNYQLPILLAREYDTFNPRSYSGALTNERYDGALAAAQARGFPVFEMVCETPWHRTTDAESAYSEIFRSIPEGLTFLSLHFNAPGDFEVIEPAMAHIRTDEYALFRTPRISQWVRDNGLEVIGLRDIRDRLRAGCAVDGVQEDPGMR